MRRLVRVAAQAAATPGGKVTEVFSVAAAREGAFRLLENDQVCVDEVAAAAHRAAASRCWGHPFAFVPADGSSMNISDHDEEKGLGVVGARSIGARGLCVMTAIAVTPDGTPMGVCGQRFWARTERAAKKGKNHDRRPVAEKETRHWLDVMAQTRVAFSREAPLTRPWFQLDRGGDAWPVLADAIDTESLVTVRAAYDRRLLGEIDGERDYLWPRLQRQRPSGSYLLEVPAGPKRQGRTAKMKVNHCRVVLEVRDMRTKKQRLVPLWAVWAHEVDTTPDGEKPIEWMLLTTFQVCDFADTQLVVAGYATRWRIEEMHKIWKSGACHVEDTQLRDRDHIERWATILCSVAMRILRLTYLSRTQPTIDAKVELSRSEIDAVVLLRRPKGVKRGARVTIGDATKWIAELGGYTGKSSGGPPGALVIARGLRQVAPVAVVLDGGEEL